MKRAKSKVLAQLKATTALKATADFNVAFDIEIQHFANSGNAKRRTYRYAVQHELRLGSGIEQLDSWAGKEKLFPWVAVASPLRKPSPDECLPGHLFCVLRLPIQTDQPVHLHGLWSIAPDRERLSTSAGSTLLKPFAAQWNTFMFSTCVASAWTRLLIYRNQTSWQDEQFDFWPKAIGQSQDPWNSLQGDVIRQSIQEKSVVWNTPFNCVNIHQAFIVEDSSPIEHNLALWAAFEAIQMPVVHLPPQLLKKVRERFPALNPALKYRTPKTVREFIEAHGLKFATEQTRLDLLEYCLEENTLVDLASIPFWPVVGRDYIKLDQHGAFLPRDVQELQVFRESRPGITIDVERLSAKTRSLLLKAFTNKSTRGPLRLRELSDLAEDWPVLYSISNKSWKAPRPQDRAESLRDLWDWFGSRSLETSESDFQGAVRGLPDTLWFFPLHGNCIRRFRVAEGSTPTLIMEKSPEVKRLLRDIADLNRDTSLPLLDSSFLLAKDLTLVRRISKSTGAHVESCEHLSSLLRWLTASKDLLSSLTDDQRLLMMWHISKLSKAGLSADRKFQIATSLRKLPLFRTAVCHVDGRISNWIALRTSEEYVDIGVLPAVPIRPGITFLDLSSPYAKVAKVFDLVKDPSTENMIVDYILPAVTSQALSRDAQEVLTDFVFFRASQLSSDAQLKLAKEVVIPLQQPAGSKVFKYSCLKDTVDPTNRSLVCLFFEDEEVFPCPEFFGRHRAALIHCGLCSNLNIDVIQERISYFASCGRTPCDIKNKVAALLRVPLKSEESSNEDFKLFLQGSKWLPATATSNDSLVMMKARECRPAEFRKLVDRVLGVADFTIEPSWMHALGWDVPISLDNLLRQLDSCAAAKDYDGLGTVLVYLQKNLEVHSYLSDLNKRRCIRGASNDLFFPQQIFKAARKGLQSRFAPYLDEVHHDFRPRILLKLLNISDKPSLEDLLSVQRKLITNSINGVLNSADLEVSICILEFAAAFPKDEHPKLMAPDDACALTNIANLTNCDAREVGEIAQTKGIRIVHPDVPRATLAKLEIDTWNERMIKLGINVEDGEDEDEFTPREELKTIIQNSLERYPVVSTFNEYLANADDCGASELNWIVDDCSKGLHRSDKLLADGLQRFQGPALFVHNDRGTVPP